MAIDITKFKSKEEYALSICFFDREFPKNRKEAKYRAHAYNYLHGEDPYSSFGNLEFIEKLNPYIEKIQNKLDSMDRFYIFLTKIIKENATGFPHSDFYCPEDRSVAFPTAYDDKELIISGLNTDHLYDFYKKSVSDPVFSDPVEEFAYYSLWWTHTHSFNDQSPNIDFGLISGLECEIGMIDEDMYQCLTYDFDYEYAREEWRKGNKDIFKKFRPMTKEERKGTMYENMWE